MKKNFLTIILCGIVAISLTGCSDSENNNKEKTLDGMQGTWYKYDRATKTIVSDTYIEPNGKGEFNNMSASKMFNQIGDGSYYAIEDNKVNFYNKSGELWVSCDLVNSDKMNCSHSGGLITTFQR